MDAKTITNSTIALLSAHRCSCVTEFTLPSGKRLDIAGFTPAGFLIGVEVKTTARDFARDTKWPDYKRYCKLFYFALPEDFNIDRFPLGPGIIKANGTRALFVRRNRWPYTDRYGRPVHSKPHWFPSANGSRTILGPDGLPANQPHL